MLRPLLSSGAAQLHHTHCDQAGENREVLFLRRHESIDGVKFDCVETFRWLRNLLNVTFYTLILPFVSD